jgi:hypothetical protein
MKSTQEGTMKLTQSRRNMANTADIDTKIEDGVYTTTWKHDDGSVITAEDTTEFACWKTREGFIAKRY